MHSSSPCAVAAAEECAVPDLRSLWSWDTFPFKYLLHGFEEYPLDCHIKDPADDLHLWLVYLIAISAFIGRETVCR